jgi:SAM-dependent methyltransferase
LRLDKLLKHINFYRKPWDRDYYERLSTLYLKEALKLFPRKHPSEVSVLDAGCGFGETLRCFRENAFDIQGIDISADCVNISQSFSKARVLKIEKLSQEFPPNYFNITICSHTMEHLENPTKALKNIETVTSDYLILAVPNLARLANLALRKPRRVNQGHKHGWDHHHLITFVENNSGFVLKGWVPDLVTFPLIRNNLIYTKFISEMIEGKILPKFFPLQCNSVIAIFRKRTMLAGE